MSFSEKFAGKISVVDNDGIVAPNNSISRPLSSSTVVASSQQPGGELLRKQTPSSIIDESLLITSRRQTPQPLPVESIGIPPSSRSNVNPTSSSNDSNLLIPISNGNRSSSSSSRSSISNLHRPLSRYSSNTNEDDVGLVYMDNSQLTTVNSATSEGSIMNEPNQYPIANALSTAALSLQSQGSVPTIVPLPMIKSNTSTTSSRNPTPIPFSSSTIILPEPSLASKVSTSSSANDIPTPSVAVPSNKLFFRNPIVPTVPSSSSLSSSSVSVSVVPSSVSPTYPSGNIIINGIRPGGAGLAASLAANSSLPSDNSASSSISPNNVMNHRKPNLFSHSSTTSIGINPKMNLDMLNAVMDNTNNDNNNKNKNNSTLNSISTPMDSINNNFHYSSTENTPSTITKHSGYSLSPKENLNRAISPIDVYQPILPTNGNKTHGSIPNNATEIEARNHLINNRSSSSSNIFKDNSVNTKTITHSSVPGKIRTPPNFPTTTSMIPTQSQKYLPQQLSPSYYNHKGIDYNDESNNPSYDDLANEPEPEISPLPKSVPMNSKPFRSTNTGRIPKYSGAVSTSPRTINQQSIASPVMDKENQQQLNAQPSTQSFLVRKSTTINNRNSNVSPSVKLATNSTNISSSIDIPDDEEYNSSSNYADNPYENHTGMNTDESTERNDAQKIVNSNSHENNNIFKNNIPTKATVPKRRNLGAGQLARAKPVGNANALLPPRASVYNTYSNANNTVPINTNNNLSTVTAQPRTSSLFTNLHGIVGPDGNIIPASDASNTLRTNTDSSVVDHQSAVPASILAARGLPAHPDHRSSYILVDHGGKRIAEELNERLVRSEQDKLAFSRKARSVHYTPHTLADYKAAKEALGMGINTTPSTNNNNSPNRHTNNTNGRGNNHDPQANNYAVLYSGGSVPPRDTIGIKGRKGIPAGYQELGTLGPDLSSDEIRNAKAARERQKNYAAEVVASTKQKVAIIKAEREHQQQLQQQIQQQQHHQQQQQLHHHHHQQQYSPNTRTLSPDQQPPPPIMDELGYNNNNGIPAYENEFFHDEDNWYNSTNTGNNNNHHNNNHPSNMDYYPSSHPVPPQQQSQQYNPQQSSVSGNIPISIPSAKPITKPGILLVHKDPAIEARNKANEIRERAKEYAKRVPKPVTNKSLLTTDNSGNHNSNSIHLSSGTTHQQDSSPVRRNKALHHGTHPSNNNSLEQLEQQHDYNKEQIDAIRKELALL